MSSHGPTTVLERSPQPAQPRSGGRLVERAAGAPRPHDVEHPAPVQVAPRPAVDPDVRMVRWGVLGFFLLGLYAAVGVVIGMWMTP